MPELRLCNRLRWCGLGGLLLLWSLAAPSLAQIVRPLDFSHSHWLWYPATPQPPEVYLRHSFRLEVPIASAHLLITADDGYEAFVNGQRVGRGEDWEHPDTYDLAGLLEPGLNVLAVRAWNREGPAGVIATLRVVVQGGRMIEWPSDATWRVWAERVEGWERVEFDDSVWLPAHLVGAYPCPPWGRLVKMSAAEMRAWLEEQPLTLEVEVVPHPPHSEFRAAYLDPAFAARYTSFLTLDRERGLILTPEGPRPFLWVHYTQPGPTPADPPVSSPLDFDYDLLEEDLPRLAKLGANPAVSGLDWRHLLRANGTWRELAAPPRGRNLPEFQYAYEVYDYFFDRVQAHGLYALVLMDYRSFLPKEVLTPERLANVLLYDPLWRTILRATQKIARYFSRRPVIAAWALGADGLPFAPGWDSPLLRERFQQFLAAHYGRVENLKTMWGTEYDLQAGEAALWPERTLPSGRRVRVPQLRRTPEVFAAWNYFADVPLPPCPPYREPEPPYKPVTEAEPALEAVRESPMWVDFNAFREELLLQRLNEWATAMQEAAPHHLLQYGQQAPFAT
ncbi:MAG TPA: hypothetical protein EYP85_11295, partial [Armatimonadetes bacterium]|nr:hypothetical protein [Armatimonadota bacterium]